MKDTIIKLYRVGQTEDYEPIGLFFTDDLDYFDYSQIEYDKKDAKEYELDLTGLKIFDPIKD